MKKPFTLVVLAVAMILSGAATAAERTVTLAVDNMTCALCPITVRKALKTVEGVTDVAVSYSDKTAMVTFDDEKTAVAELTAATTRAGYPSKATE